MSAVLEAEDLTKRYRRQSTLTECTLEIPEGHVVGLVGPNCSGKTTLLNLAAGLLAPTSGSIEVLGRRPAESSTQLERVGFVAQDTPIYSGLSVRDHLRFGAHTNPRWDAALAKRRVAQLVLELRKRAGKLSGGQRAQLALTLAITKRPEILLLDEPVASWTHSHGESSCRFLWRPWPNTRSASSSRRIWSRTSRGPVATWSFWFPRKQI